MPTSILSQPTSLKPLRLIPKALKPQGMASYFVNVQYVIAPRARGALEEQLAQEGVQIYQTELDYALLPPTSSIRNPKAGKQQSAENKIEWQNFLALMGLFQGFGPIFREKIYNHSNWMGLLGSSWASVAFWRPYIELLSLNNLFAPSKSATGSYVLYHNHLPHNSGFASSHDYFGNPDNFRFPLPRIPKILQKQDEQNGNQDLATLFLANYQSLYLVADWLETLKTQGLYDNTLIYLVSDHGSTAFDPSFAVQGREGQRSKGNWHSLYMRKDFAARGSLRTDNNFRTVADIPSEFLPQFGVLKNPHNEKPLQPVRSEPIPLYVVEGIQRGEQLVGKDYQYYIRSQYYLHNRDIFTDQNWKIGQP